MFLLDGAYRVFTPSIHGLITDIETDNTHQLSLSVKVRDINGLLSLLCVASNLWFWLWVATLVELVVLYAIKGSKCECFEKAFALILGALVVGGIWAIMNVPSTTPTLAVAGVIISAMWYVITIIWAALVLDCWLDKKKSD